jgi:tetratricopeptide (TPR) repeat protein
MRPATIHILLISACAAVLPAAAQRPRPNPPIARPVQPALRADPGNDYFQRAKNLYDVARQTRDAQTRIAAYERAIPLLTDYLTRFGNHKNAVAAWYYLGRSYYHTGHIPEASRCFHTVLRRFGKGPYAAASASALAVDHYTRKEFALAASLFKTAAQNAPRVQDQQRAIYYRALCLHQLGRTREAITAYKKVIALERKGTTGFSGPSRLAIAHLLARSGKEKDALQVFEQIVTNAGDQKVRGEAALYAGIIAGKLGDTEKSERYLRMVLTTPGMGVWRPKAQIALMTNRYEEKKYQEVIKLFTRSRTPAEGLDEGRRKMLAALSYMQLGSHAKALELFRNVESIVPPTSDIAFDAAYNRLLCFYKIDGAHVGEQADAFIQIYGKARRRDPRIHTARLMKAETLFTQRKFREAAETFKKIEETLVNDANRPGLLFQRGWCLAVAGDYQGAINSLTKFIDSYPKDKRVPEALAKRAEAHLENGNKNAALKDLDTLISLNPPKKLTSFAWQKSARISKENNNIPEMIRRYQAMLENVPGLAPQVVANADYWIGWGRFKQDKLAEALPPLRKARELDAKTYGRQAGLVLSLALFALQDVDGLTAELDRAIKGGYIDAIPEQAIRWLGPQLYNAGRYRDAARFLSIIATPDDPRQTPKVVWRYLGKSLLETGKAAEALAAIDHVLDIEDRDVWKADSQLDRSRALLALDRSREALEAANDGLALRPRGRIGSGLRLAAGDASFAVGNYDEAIKHYVYVVEFVEDKELRPKALAKLIRTLEKKGDTNDAQRYRKMLKTEFPGYSSKQTIPKKPSPPAPKKPSPPTPKKPRSR